MTTSVDAVTAKTPGLTSRQARELPENELEQVSGGLSPTGNQDGMLLPLPGFGLRVNFTAKSREP